MRQALVIIDMQQIMQDRIEAGRDHVNGQAAQRIVDLAESFRARGMPVLHVRHHEADPASPLHADAPGAAPLTCDMALAGEPVFIKSTSSAFASTDLADHLRREGIGALVVTGAVAGFCVNSTVRAGCDLGFAMTVARDAVLGFDLPEAGLSAETIFAVTMAHLAADFARVVESDAVLAPA
ncbi:isochorismatase [Xaviernesmea oryzae]|uniref:Isochorismatase n=1 Tax=Xaviernesmea oryzae TaxID=464029 RepID=A0A1Q9B177_9HYPH|nr:isochorismatase family protein [Xaviernesmea oryzae]OLP61779.1 isochorismatase [Xaviernesmea oryzae]SEL77591.1 Nicotinamidase-related amidase [Xaviernesmea oryzae]